MGDLHMLAEAMPRLQDLTAYCGGGSAPAATEDKLAWAAAVPRSVRIARLNCPLQVGFSAEVARVLPPGLEALHLQTDFAGVVIRDAPPPFPFASLRRLSICDVRACLRVLGSRRMVLCLLPSENGCSRAPPILGTCYLH